MSGINKRQILNFVLRGVMSDALGKGTQTREVLGKCEVCDVTTKLCLDCEYCLQCCPFEGVLCREGVHHAEGDANNTGYCSDCFYCNVCHDNQCLWLDEDSIAEDGLPKAKVGCKRK